MGTSDSEDSEIKTIADVARLAGVSPSTASRALRDSPLISQRTKERVRAIAERHAYRPHLGARHLRLQYNSTIVLVLPLDVAENTIMKDPFVLKFLGAVGQALREQGYDLLLSKLTAVNTRVDDDYILSGLADGAILLGRGSTRKYDGEAELNRLARTGVPFVVWGPQLPDQEYCSVGIDNVSSAAAVVHHLAAQGRRRIAIIADTLDQGNTEANLRYQGYRQALSDLKLPFDENRVAHGSYDGESGYTAVRQLLQNAPDIDALFVAYSDVVAIAAMLALHEAGRRIPTDVAVVGFDNIDLSAYTFPPLTTVSQRLRHGGAALLVQKLLDRIAARPVQSVELEGKLIIRQSCGGADRLAPATALT